MSTFGQWPGLAGVNTESGDKKCENRVDRTLARNNRPGFVAETAGVVRREIA
jgi:hypothetical protein